MINDHFKEALIICRLGNLIMARTKQTARRSTGGRAHDLLLVTQAAMRRAQNPNRGGLKHTHRYRPGMVALREIRKFQQNTDMLEARSPPK